MGYYYNNRIVIPSWPKLAFAFLLASSMALGEENVLSLKESTLPDLRPSPTSDPRSSNNLLTSAARSVNLSFFIPAFTLFPLVSQLMSQMFPTFATATTSSRAFPPRASNIARSRSRSSSSISRGRFTRGKNTSNQ